MQPTIAQRQSQVHFKSFRANPTSTINESRTKLMNPLQFGFRKGASTADAFLFFIKSVPENIEQELSQRHLIPYLIIS